MDPDCLWRDLLDAIQRQDFEESVALATDLHEWLTRGGFPPCVIPALREASKEQLSVAWKFQHELATAACAFVISMT